MKHNRLNQALFTLILVISLLSLTPGCKSSSTTSTTSTTSNSTSVTGSVKPTGAQILRVNLAAEPVTIDPNKASWAQERTVINQVFVGMLGFNQDLSLRADVASTIPTVANGGISADGLTYTFKLKSNATWSDNKPVVAGDFEYSIKRMLDPAIAAEYASFYYDIVGAEAYNSSTATDAAALTNLKNAIGVKAIDNTTLQITLVNALPTFLDLMALWPAYPLRQDIITQFGDKWTEPPNYIGNGPFILTEWVHQDHLTFKQNPNYWQTKPFLTEIDLKDIADVNAELAAYKNGELDFSRVPTGTEKATMSDSSVSNQILRYNDLTTFAFRFNVTQAPFDNLLVREAFATAVDRNAFVNNVRGGVGKPATSWIPPGMPGYNPSLGTQFNFDPAKAKSLLAQAGYSDVSKLPAITFSYADSAGNRTIAEFLQGQLKDNLGITITLQPMESKAASAAINAKQYMISWYGWGADYPDPDNWLPQLFGTGAGNNKQNYSNPQFDTLSAQALKELDNTKRLAEWDQAQQIVVNDCPMIWMFYRERFWLESPSVKGLKTTGMDGQLCGDTFFSSVYLVH
jgi:oligopeptide transport system substrate-binding protein